VLFVTRKSDQDPFLDYFTKPIHKTRKWPSDMTPLSDFNYYNIISGEMLTDLMAQFKNFPDYQMFEDDDVTYLTAICAQFPDF
jgi:hypothetical protein